MQTGIKLAFVVVAAAACTKGAPEPGSQPVSLSQTGGGAASISAVKTAEAATGEAQHAAPPPAMPTPAAQPRTDDPLHGQWTLAQATQGIKGSGALIATMEVAGGNLTCKLYEDKAPVTVANFVGLARGTRTWKHPLTHEWVQKPAYDGTTFHRIIKGFMIQGGDAAGNGTGEPGYVIPDEMWAGATHDHPGLLCMANRGPNTNGAQFFIMDGAAAHLDRSYTIFGECGPVETVHKLAETPVQGDRAISAPVIKKITIAREKA